MIAINSAVYITNNTYRFTKNMLTKNGPRIEPWGTKQIIPDRDN